MQTSLLCTDCTRWTPVQIRFKINTDLVTFDATFHLKFLVTDVDSDPVQTSKADSVAVLEPLHSAGTAAYLDGD